MHIIKRFLRKLYAKRTGRTCARCAHNCGGKCKRPYEQFMACWHSITRPGFRKKRQRPAPAPLTEAQAHQLALIKDALDEASQTAQDGGLLDNEYI